MDPENLNPNLKKLTKYKKEGYYFHGTNDPNIEVLEPRQTYDDEADAGYTVDNAVFATPMLEAAIFFAAMDSSRVPREIGSGVGWAVGSDENTGMIFAHLPRSWRKYLLEAEGAVFVLPKEPFEGEELHEGWQVKTHQKVVPIDKVRVAFEDFELMGGEFRWE